MYHTVVTICTAQWSLYVPHSGHYMYRTVVTICTAQWSLYLPHSGHYMYRTVVTICTTQWSLYVPTGFNVHNSTFCPHTVFICSVQHYALASASPHHITSLLTSLTLRAEVRIRSVSPLAVHRTRNCPHLPIARSHHK